MLSDWRFHCGDCTASSVGHEHTPAVVHVSSLQATQACTLELLLCFCCSSFQCQHVYFNSELPIAPRKFELRNALRQYKCVSSWRRRFSSLSTVEFCEKLCDRCCCQHIYNLSEKACCAYLAKHIMLPLAADKLSQA